MDLHATRITRLTITSGLLVLGLAAAPGAAYAASDIKPAEVSAQTRAAEIADGVVDSRADSGTQNTSTLQGNPTLERGQTLAPGEALVSPSGQYSLFMDPDGTLLLRKSPNRLNPDFYEQELGVFGVPNSRLVLQTDSNLVLYGPDNSVQFSFDTAGSGAQSLAVQDDGNVVLYSAVGSVIIDFDTAAPDALFPGGTLLPGERLTSEDNGTSLVMQADGNLVLYTGSTVRFATGTSRPGAGLVVQDDGNVVMYSTEGLPLFSTRTAGVGFFLVVSDREFRVFSLREGISAPESLDDFVVGFGSAWGTDVVEAGMGLLQGDRRSAPNGVVLAMQTDGALVVYDRDGRVRFATRPRASAFAEMQLDGNFVVYDFPVTADEPVAVFATRTSGNPGSRLVIQTDANLVVYTPSNRAIFATLR